MKIRILVGAAGAALTVLAGFWGCGRGTQSRNEPLRPAPAEGFSAAGAEEIHEPGGFASGGPREQKFRRRSAAPNAMSDPIEKTDPEWRRELTPEQYKILRQKGTERAFTGALWNNHEKGVYRCAGCGAELFRSDDKFESGTGWPSFTAPAAKEAVRTEADRGFFMVRTEVLCRRCEGHLGHVFDDGPEPTGVRYCINSAALKFDKKAETK